MMARKSVKSGEKSDFIRILMVDLEHSSPSGPPIDLKKLHLCLGIYSLNSYIPKDPSRLIKTQRLLLPLPTLYNQVVAPPSTVGGTNS